MKTKIVPMFLSVLVLLTVAVSVAAAQDKGNATSAAAKEAARGNATSTANRDDNASSTNAKNNNASSTDGQLNAAEHRSTVAAFVQSLLSVANREGGIGAEVRAIAQAQNDSASTSVNAITKVESRSKLQTFLFGSDYKSLGQLRSEIVTTQNNIDQLNKIIAKAAYNNKAELEAQVKALEDNQVKLEAFVKSKEGSFSLFGWLVKAFAK